MLIYKAMKNTNLERALFDALVYYKDIRFVPNQDDFIEYVTRGYQGEMSEEVNNQIAEFYHLHFE